MGRLSAVLLAGAAALALDQEVARSTLPRRWIRRSGHTRDHNEGGHGPSDNAQSDQIGICRIDQFIVDFLFHPSNNPFTQRLP